jgi:hypothetical protein
MTPKQRTESLASGEASASTFREFAKVPSSMRARSKEMDRFCEERFHGPNVERAGRDPFDERRRRVGLARAGL